MHTDFKKRLAYSRPRKETYFVPCECLFEDSTYEVLSNIHERYRALRLCIERSAPAHTTSSSAHRLHTTHHSTQLHLPEALSFLQSRALNVHLRNLLYAHVHNALYAKAIRCAVQSLQTEALLLTARSTLSQWKVQRARPSLSRVRAHALSRSLTFSFLFFVILSRSRYLLRARPDSSNAKQASQ